MIDEVDTGKIQLASSVRDIDCSDNDEAMEIPLIRDHPQRMPAIETPGDKSYSAVFEKLKSNDCTIRGRRADERWISDRSGTFTGSSPRPVNGFGDRRDRLLSLGRSLGNIKNSPEITMRGIAANPVAVMAA